MIGARPYEAIAVGDHASLVRRVTADDVRRFVEMTGDDNPLHVDPAYAATTAYKEVVAHGMLGASWVSTLIGTQLPGKGALWVSQAFDFLAPVRLDDELTLTVAVLAKHDRERLLDVEVRVVNQHKQPVLAGQGKVKVLAPAAPAATAAVPSRRVALVTGGAGGIGRAVCERLAADGFRVVLGYRGGEARAKEVVAAIAAAGGEAVALQADLARADEARALAAEAARAFGPITCLVHNAAPRVGPTPFADLDWPALARHLDVQVQAALVLTQAVAPAMREAGFGRIVAVTSQEADGAPTPGWTAYAVAKAALAALVRGMAAELGPAGITVNAVAPGMTDTALIGDIPEKTRLILAQQTPTRRLATPADVARAVAWLASDDAGQVNGETIRVNGGRVMR